MSTSKLPEWAFKKATELYWQTDGGPVVDAVGILARVLVEIDEAGRNRGLEEAASLVEFWDASKPIVHAVAIRALKSQAPEGSGSWSRSGSL